MGEADVGTAAATPGRGRSAAAAVALVVVAATGGLVWGQRHPTVHVEEARCLSLRTQIACVLPDGWDVGVSTDLPWTSARGDFHENGRPGCLPPTGRGESGPVLLHWLETRTEGGTRRSVVEVTCLR